MEPVNDLSGKTDNYIAQRNQHDIGDNKVETERFVAFKDWLISVYKGVLKVDSVKDLPFEKLEYAFDILESTRNFSFDDKDERYTSFLLNMATLSILKNRKVCYICPTWWFSRQAGKRLRGMIRDLEGSTKHLSVTVPGMSEFENSVRKSDVVFMHGKDFSEDLPKQWNGRKVVQIFPGENVPVDSRRINLCAWFHGHRCD